jgi:hypothetical protein
MQNKENSITTTMGNISSDIQGLIETVKYTTFILADIINWKNSNYYLQFTLIRLTQNEDH